MRLLLTSAGISTPAIASEFSRLVNKRFSAVKAILIPTASRSKEELVYVEESKKQLLSLGIKTIKSVNLDHAITKTELDWFDVVYVCGGNTFYLLDQARKNDFGPVIKQFANNVGVYVGVSAGSILVGPSVETALPFDTNDVKMKDFTGLGLTDVIVYPHYTEKDKAQVEELKRKSKHPIAAITDTQALLIEELQKIIL